MRSYWKGMGINMELKLKYGNFQRCKGVYQHYFLYAALTEAAIFEFEGNRYQIDCQVPVDSTPFVKDTIMLDFYDSALKACGGKKVKSHFFDCIKDAVNDKAGECFQVVAEPVRCGKAQPIGVEVIEGKKVQMYRVEGMTLTAPVTWMTIHIRLKAPLDVVHEGSVYPLDYDQKLTFLCLDVD